MGVVACGFFALQFFVRPTAGARFGLNSCGLAFALFMISFIRNRIFFRDGTAGVRGIILTKKVYLDQLTMVVVRQAHGRVRYWSLELYDSNGNKFKVNFDGFDVHDRLRWLAAVKPYAWQPSVQYYGPIEQAFEGMLWWPKLPGAGGKARRRTGKKGHDPARHAR